MPYSYGQVGLLLNPLPVAACLWSRTTEEFLGSNQAFRDLLGYTEVELLNLNWRELVVPDEIVTAERAIRVGPVMERVRWHWRKKDRSIIPVTLATRGMPFIDDQGKKHEAYFAVVLSTGEEPVPSAAAFPDD